jgi:hypothetical protein
MAATGAEPFRVLAEVGRARLLLIGWRQAMTLPGLAPSGYHSAPSRLGAESLPMRGRGGGNRYHVQDHACMPREVIRSTLATSACCAAGNILTCDLCVAFAGLSALADMSRRHLVMLLSWIAQRVVQQAVAACSSSGSPPAATGSPRRHRHCDSQGWQYCHTQQPVHSLRAVVYLC